MIFTSCGSRSLTFVPASCVTPQTHPCTSYAEVNITRIQIEQQQSCSRAFGPWRISSFHIIPLSLKELDQIQVWVYQNGEGRGLWWFFPTIRVIQEPSLPESGAAPWLCNLLLLEGIFHNRAVSKDQCMYLHQYLWVSLEIPKSTNFYAVCFNYFPILCMFVPKWCDAVLAMK